MPVPEDVTAVAQAPEEIAEVPRAAVPLAMVCVSVAEDGMLVPFTLVVEDNEAGTWLAVNPVALLMLIEVGVPKTPPFGMVTVPVNVGDASGAYPVKHPNPVPLVQLSASPVAEQDGTANPDGVVAVNAPSTVFAVCDASALFGIADAATASVGVVVELVTVGTSQVGHDPEDAVKEVTDPEPVGAVSGGAGGFAK
jgi:hypothetical protein